MLWMILLAGAAGGIVGGVVGSVRFDKGLIGLLVGAGCGAAAMFVFGPSPAQVLAVDSADEFRTEVLNSDVPVVVDFYADWCPPCRALAPTIESLAGEYKGRVRFVKVNVDEARGLAGAYGIRSIPTVMLVVKSNVAYVWRGNAPAEAFRPVLDAAAPAGK